MTGMASPAASYSARHPRSLSGGASSRGVGLVIRPRSQSAAATEGHRVEDGTAAGPPHSRTKADAGHSARGRSRAALLRMHNEQLQDVVECNRQLLAAMEQSKLEKQALERQLKNLRERLAQYDLKLGPAAAGAREDGCKGAAQADVPDGGCRSHVCDMGVQTDPFPAPQPRRGPMLPSTAVPVAGEAERERVPPGSPTAAAVNAAKKRIALRRLDNSTPERIRKAPPPPERVSQQVQEAQEEHRQELLRWMEQAAGLQELNLVLQSQVEASTSHWLLLQDNTRKAVEALQLTIHFLKEELTCPICLDLFSPDTVTLQSCGHSLCRTCLFSLKNVECPSCRAPFFDPCPAATHKSSCIIQTFVQTVADLERALQPLCDAPDGRTSAPVSA
eukprot:GGOE01061868.1.p1 GENE.GGOE01061868.1~~GGOE01061868.1.p1  ORF type:complete len:390 (+),score=84.65 GGOE01061868.1:140-1309(+)